jgi:hypothetical protein
MQKSEPQAEHRWLHKLVGEWTYEGEASMGPDKPAEKIAGRDLVRSLGGLWVLCEGSIDVPDGSTHTSVMTLGFDLQKKRFVGTFVGSTMNNLWVYEGLLDRARTSLALDAEGPDFSMPGKTSKFRDVIEFHSDDHRVLTSNVLGEDDQWHRFMTAHYRRQK